MEKYISAIRKNVCSICVDSTTEGSCMLQASEVCALEKYLPQIVDIVRLTDEAGGGDYMKALREGVCADCRTQGRDGYCRLREDVNCSLDRYFPLIVDIIHREDEDD